MKLVYVPDGQNGYCSWLKQLDIHVTNDPNKADILLLSGGEDINPAIYKQKRGRLTGYPNEARDRFEIEAYNRFKEQGKPIIGVCRGSQLCCALQEGGALVQHMQHSGMHPVITNDGRKMSSNSYHHEQMLLRDINTDNYELLAWAETPSSIHLGENDIDYDFGPDYKDPEVVLFQGHILSIQPHPECMSITSEFVQYCQNLVRKYILNEQEQAYELIKEKVVANHWTMWDD